VQAILLHTRSSSFSFLGAFLFPGPRRLFFFFLRGRLALLFPLLVLTRYPSQALVVFHLYPRSSNKKDFRAPGLGAYPLPPFFTQLPSSRRVERSVYDLIPESLSPPPLRRALCGVRDSGEAPEASVDGISLRARPPPLSFAFPFKQCR